MKPIPITDNIYWIGVNDEKTRLFEGLWPIEKEGISYNSYLIKDEKITLIDLCKDMMSDELIGNIRQLIDPTQISYLIVNHMEPDHSGAIKALLNAAPQLTIIGSQKTRKMLDDHFGITEGIQTVADGDTLSLGKHTLLFLSTPMVHWPETMMTFESSTKTLFPCDGFGGYGKLSEGIFDEDYDDLSFYESESLRYFSNIVCAFSKPVLNAAAKLEKLDIHIVAPSHGLIWRKDPQRILNLYVQWSQYAKGTAENGISLIYGSMYGNTQKMVEAVFEGVKQTGTQVKIFDITKTHISYILPALWTQRGVLIGAPTYEGSLFPTMRQVLEMALTKRIFHKKAAYFGSYGWSGGAIRYLKRQLEKLKWELTDTLDFMGQPTTEELKNGVGFGQRFAAHIHLE
ncbi:MAG TPA: FprA family A-type flavoprotein [Anaerolineae bacterium]|nr:FprA family A-type flavoprotein [Anaerolineae bacterium]